MAMKIDRRAFLKTSAAMAVVVSMTGLLGGCSDGDIGTDLCNRPDCIIALNLRCLMLSSNLSAFRINRIDGDPGNSHDHFA